MKLALIIIGFVIYAIGIIYTAYVLSVDDDTHHYKTDDIIAGIMVGSWPLALPFLFVMNPSLGAELHARHLYGKQKKISKKSSIKRKYRRNIQ